MKSRILTLTFVGAALIFTACTDKKKKEESKSTKIEKVDNSKDHGHPHDANGGHSVNSTKKIDEAEKRRLDSIRQVKEHGHAH